jgi:membrane protein insertase Oxa1/YidC/SpoIIIJ
VIQGAHTSARFAKVVPEIQFLMTLFTNDYKQLRQRKDSTWVERYALMRTNFQTLSGLYKLHNINPLAVFYSPLLQLPIFWCVGYCMTCAVLVYNVHLVSLSSHYSLFFFFHLVCSSFPHTHTGTLVWTCVKL